MRRQTAWLLVALGAVIIAAAVVEALRPKCSCVLGEYKFASYGLEAGIDDPADCEVHGPLFKY